MYIYIISFGEENEYSYANIDFSKEIKYINLNNFSIRDIALIALNFETSYIRINLTIKSKDYIVV